MDQAPTTNDSLPYDVLAALYEAEHKAWDSLARYKFQMFGYWAAIWVHMNRLGKFGKPNPFKSLVDLARIEKAETKKKGDSR